MREAGDWISQISIFLSFLDFLLQLNSLQTQFFKIQFLKISRFEKRDPEQDETIWWNNLELTNTQFQKIQTMKFFVVVFKISRFHTSRYLANFELPDWWPTGRLAFLVRTACTRFGSHLVQFALGSARTAGLSSSARWTWREANTITHSHVVNELHFRSPI